jgi:excisionase family DNA binding protein
MRAFSVPAMFGIFRFNARKIVWAPSALSDIAVECLRTISGERRRYAMTAQVLQFVELSDHDRKQAEPFYRPAEGDQIEVRIKRRAGGDHTLTLPPQAAALVGSLLDHLMRGERIAILTEDQELTPNEAAAILGISRPLVVHRMDVGDLPFRYVGKHRRTKLKDVLALKARIDAQQAALDALAENTELLMRDYGL